MTQRRLALAAGLVALLVAACGDGDSAASTTAPPPSTSAAPATTIAAPTTAATPGTTTTAAADTTTTAVTTTTAAAGTVIEVTIASGDVTGPTRPRVPLGTDVQLIVSSDQADEVHVHGYDVYLDVGPGAPSDTTFTANIPGVFEVELEGSGTLLFELEVS